MLPKTKKFKASLTSFWGYSKTLSKKIKIDPQTKKTLKKNKIKVIEQGITQKTTIAKMLALNIGLETPSTPPIS
ncbi:MAG TPA: hypothetical protein VKO42_01190 [Patescibacteria group bacterium]|nr:hypothetical protein [Patescibacteria group bacterium]